jgi:hypothetical protein
LIQKGGFMKTEIKTLKVTKKGAELYDVLKNKFEPGMKKNSFLEKLCESYINSHCAECSRELDVRRCNCNGEG